MEGWVDVMDEWVGGRWNGWVEGGWMGVVVGGCDGLVVYVGGWVGDG